MTLQELEGLVSQSECTYIPVQWTSWYLNNVIYHTGKVVLLEANPVYRSRLVNHQLVPHTVLVLHSYTNQLEFILIEELTYWPSRAERGET